MRHYTLCSWDVIKQVQQSMETANTQTPDLLPKPHTVVSISKQLSEPRS